MKQIIIVVIVLALAVLACDSATPDAPVVRTATTVSGATSAPQATSAPTIIKDTATTPPTAAPKPTATKPVGTSRDNPVPAGQSVIASSMALTITGATRPADLIVAQGNMFNKKPEAGKEYVMIELAATCEGKTDQKCSINPFFFKAVGSAGVVADYGFVTGVPGSLESGEFFGGAKKVGKLFFIIGKDETNIVLIFNQLLGSDIYFALPEAKK